MVSFEPNKFQEILLSFSYKENGDKFEKEYWSYLNVNFPNHEILWKILVVPMTNRVDTYSLEIAKEIDFRKGVNDKLIQLSSTHYSILLNLIFAQIHIKNKLICSPENIFFHLGTVCDLVEKFIIDWYLIKSKCENKEVVNLQSLTENDFLNLAKKWYQKKYFQLYDYYYSKGKPYSIAIPTRESIINEYLVEFLKIKDEYSKISLDIRHYRNIIAHNNKIGRIIGKEEKHFIPNPEKILEYKSWVVFESASLDKKKFENDFVEIWELINGLINKLENVLNSLWEIFIRDFNNIFFEVKNENLLVMYGISYSDSAKNERMKFLYGQFGMENEGVIPSGTFTSGSGSWVVGFPED